MVEGGRKAKLLRIFALFGKLFLLRFLLLFLPRIILLTVRLSTVSLH
jgi:hypothetical protein